MSHKKALPDDITQFFKGQSVFFQKAKNDDGPVDGAATKQQKKQDTLKQQATRVASNHATMPPQNQVTTHPSRSADMKSANPAALPPSMVEEIRKAVKPIGKDAATYRLTEAEKQHLADIVYTYKRQGYRTSDNELARIAINWLLLDYQEQGEQSILARVLEALNR